MDNIKDQVSNLSLYDIKAGVRKVQNGMSAVIITMSISPELWTQFPSFPQCYKSEQPEK